MRLLYFGTLAWGSTSLQRFKALCSLIKDIYGVDSRIYLDDYLFRSALKRVQIRLQWPGLINRIGKGLLGEIKRYKPDCIWVDNGILISPHFLFNIRRDNKSTLIHFTLDSLFAKGMGSVLKKSLKYYDLCFTTKPQDISYYKRIGVRNIYLLWQGYDSELFNNVNLRQEDFIKYGHDVIFIGEYTKKKLIYIKAIMNNVNCNFGLYGRGWDKIRYKKYFEKYYKGWLYGEEYVKALMTSKIALCLLNENVHDEYTTRSLEIPASGTLMIAEDTSAHRLLFKENEEAVFFKTEKELVDKIKYYLLNEEERAYISKKGKIKIQTLKLSWQDQMSKCLDIIDRVRYEQKN